VSWKRGDQTPYVSLVALNGSGTYPVMPHGTAGVPLTYGWVLLPGPAPSSIAGHDRPGRPHRRHGGDCRPSTDTRVALPPVRAGVGVPGAGSTFTVTVPLTAHTGGSARTDDVHTTQVRADVAPAEDPAHSGARVLVVEDDADLRTYLTRLLTGDGWRVHAVADAETRSPRSLTPTQRCRTWW